MAQLQLNFFWAGVFILVPQEVNQLGIGEYNIIGGLEQEHRPAFAGRHLDLMGVPPWALHLRRDGQGSRHQGAGIEVGRIG